jgi:methylated-DNA-protein-cysteine methyltransferase-like protein
VRPKRDRSFEDAVVRAIEALGRGEVASYGEIAENAGFPGAARAVGRILASIDGLPWWRVVGADGRLLSPNAGKQARLLQREGVEVSGGRVIP